MNTFSERQGLVGSTALGPTVMPIEVRNRIWNVVQNYIDKEFQGRSNRNVAILYIWDKFFKENKNYLKKSPFSDYYLLDQIQQKFYQLAWNAVYDFLEFLISIVNSQEYVNNFIGKLNGVFIDERVQYKIIKGYVTPLISGEEAEEVDSAINNKYGIVSGHIKKALEFYKKRPVADYQNSIKESISALEALGRIVLNKPSATLGELAEQLNVHPAFKDAIKKLYGWTSDEGGIRHAEKDGKNLGVGEAEARFMLVQCSALVNYVITKYEK